MAQSSYFPALLSVYGHLQEFPRTGQRGRPCKAIREPAQDLVYAQVIKQKEKGRLTELQARIVVGADRLLALGLKVSTSLIERVNH